MSNSFYNHSIYPAPNAPGSSAAFRAELDLITGGFNKMPTLAGNGIKVIRVKTDGTGLEAVSSLTGLTIDSTVIGATTPAAGTFTTITASGGSLNGVAIGATTPSTAIFTDLTVTGVLDMSVISAGTITGLTAPSSASDAVNLQYVTTLYGSTSAAAVSASAAASSASAASTNATATANSSTSAGTSATNASASATSAASSFSNFDLRYLGPKSADPSVNNSGGALTAGMLYYNTTVGITKSYNGTTWEATYIPASGYLAKTGGTMTGALNVPAGASGTEVPQAQEVLLKTGGTLTGNVGATDNVLSRFMLKDTGYVYYNSSTTNALDYVNGTHQRWSPSTGAQTLSITNWPPSGNLGELLIEGVNLGASTITWPTINWIKADGSFTTTFSSNGVTLQTSGTDWVLLWTRDAGTTIYGKVIR